MKFVNCNYCGENNTELVNQGPDLLLNRPGEYKLVRCLNCGLIYQNPQLTREELSDHYPDDYLLYDTTEDNKSHSLITRLSQQHALSRRCQRVMRHAASPGTMLDIGCATGQFMAAMHDRGWEVKGIELSDYAAEYGRNTLGLSIETGTLEDVTFPDDSFDLITLWDVFEHVNDPQKTLAEITRILKPGGILAMSLPNPTCFEAKLFGSTWIGWERPRHLHLFTPKVLKSYLSDVGFIVQSLESFSGRLSVTLISVEFWLKSRDIPEDVWQNWLRFAYSLPFRLLTWPLYRIGELLNQTTGMTVFAKLDSDKN